MPPAWSSRGDRVDLILTHKVSQGRGAQQVSETILENMRILAIDQSLNDQSNQPRVGKTATFEVTPKQAEILAVASGLGKLSLSLRSLAKDEAELERLIGGGVLDESGASRGGTYTRDTEASMLKGYSGSGVTVVRGGIKKEEKGRLMIAQKLRRATAALGLAMMAGLAAAPQAQSAGSTTAIATKAIDVELNEGRLIKLSGDATSVFIANPGIADVAIKSPRLVYIFGKTPGETTLYAVDRNDRMIASLRVMVNHNLSGLNGALRRVIPGSDIKATSIDGAIILTGTVTDSVDAENARRIAARYHLQGRRGPEPDPNNGTQPGEPAGHDRRGRAVGDQAVRVQLGESFRQRRLRSGLRSSCLGHLV